MKQSELIGKVAKKGRMTKAEAGRMVDLVMGELETGVKQIRKDGSVSIPRLGSQTAIGTDSDRYIVSSSTFW